MSRFWKGRIIFSRNLLTEKKICLTFWQCVFNSEIKPITREARVAAAQADNLRPERQQKKRIS
jgi:hypothetical protein